ncbi:MAG: hypothetical protein NT150_01665 [Bacteroidetes bacterium]|nr:hypothetical protein [Bacteroidota bacterium]
MNGDDWRPATQDEITSYNANGNSVGQGTEGYVQKIDDAYYTFVSEAYYSYHGSTITETVFTNNYEYYEQNYYYALSKGVVDYPTKISFETKAFAANDIGLAPTTGADAGVIILNMDGTVTGLYANEYGMVEMPLSGNGFTTYNRNDEKYQFDMTITYNGHTKNYKKGEAITDGFGTPSNIAKLINLAADFSQFHQGTVLSIGDLSDEMGNSPLFFDYRKNVYRRHASHYNGTQADFRNLVKASDVQDLITVANNLGFNHIHMGTKYNGNIKGVGLHFNHGHDDHLHIGFTGR